MIKEIEILKGNEAKRKLRDQSFVKVWNELATDSDHQTLMQEPKFVETWYSVYDQMYELILITGYDTQSKLIGIIPLCLRDNMLTHAGEMQAEYHGWICKKEYESDFVSQALVIIKKKFNLQKWVWGWTPPHININSIDLKFLNRRNVFVKKQVRDSPILSLTDQNKIDQLKKSRSLKTKINRLKKRGALSIVKIKQKEDAEKIINAFQQQSNFRKIAMQQAPPFLVDLLKKNYLLKKMNNHNNIHFTALMLNDTPIAFHFGECDHETVYLSLISHDPTYGKNSPGQILMLKLIELLQKEGYKYFDLTPGGDDYKYKYANHFNRINFVTIYFDKWPKIRHDIKDLTKHFFKRTLLKLNLDPTEIAKSVSNILSFDVLKESWRSLHTKTAVYKFTRIENINTFKNASEINMNNYEDLLLGVKANNWKTNVPLFSNAQRNFNQGNFLYTKLQGQKLIYSCWMITKLPKVAQDALTEKFNVSPSSIILNDLFIESGSNQDEGLIDLFQKMILEAHSNDKSEICLILNKKHQHLESIIKPLGFELLGYTKKRIL